jgi:tetratricopeptide (TPR) repeat protein
MLSDLSATATRDRNSVLHTKAIVAEARNELDRALPLYDDAARRWSNFGFPLEKGHALFGAARCLTLLNRREEALRTFEKARRIFAKLGASPLVAEVDDHLPESTTGSR